MIKVPAHRLPGGWETALAAALLLQDWDLGAAQHLQGRRCTAGHLPLGVGGMEGEPEGEESSESRYHVASSTRDLLLRQGAVLCELHGLGAADDTGLAGGGGSSGTHLPFWASPGLGELGPQAQQARLSPLLESSRRRGDWRPQAWPGSAGSTGGDGKLRSVWPPHPDRLGSWCIWGSGDSMTFAA